jgi:hypothetical protein
MPAIKVERLRQDGPFRAGDRYEVAPDGSAERFPGVVAAVRPTGPQHVQVTVELSDAEYERMLAAE